MYFDFVYITPTQLIKKHPDCRQTLEELQAIARRKTRTCENCDNLEWKYGNTGMCFACTTGETDASEDYELIPD